MEEIKEKIRKQLIELDYINRKVNYTEFLKLYEPYQKYISENQFADILEITFNGLNNLKKSYKNTVRILKTDEIDEGRKDEIKEELIAKKFVNKSVTYEEFLQLYEMYKKEMTELQFASILKISYGSLKSVKNGINKTITILPLIEGELKPEREHEVYIHMKKNYYNTEIGLDDFLELYEPYQSEMTKKEFAKILEMSKTDYNLLMYYGKKIKIFEPTYSQIRRKVIEDVEKNLYNNGRITNEEFLVLYELYREYLSKKQLADILGINLKKGVKKYKINLKKRWYR